MTETMSLDLPTLLAIGFIGGLIAGVIASGRGLSFGGYFVLGFLLPIVGIIVALVAHPNRLSQLTAASGVGWWTDPTGRFDHRYFDGRVWTRHVARAGTRFEDPL